MQHSEKKKQQQQQQQEQRQQQQQQQQPQRRKLLNVALPQSRRLNLRRKKCGTISVDKAVRRKQMQSRHKRARMAGLRRYSRVRLVLERLRLALQLLFGSPTCLAIWHSVNLTEDLPVYTPSIRENGNQVQLALARMSASLQTAKICPSGLHDGRDQSTLRGLRMMRVVEPEAVPALLRPTAGPKCEQPVSGRSKLLELSTLNDVKTTRRSEESGAWRGKEREGCH